MHKIIGIAGQLRNGKTSIADFLLPYLDSDYSKISFAAPIKKIVCDVFGVTLEFIEKWKPLKEIPPGFDVPMRDVLVLIGDGFRKIRSTVWMDKALEGLSRSAILDDCRYQNEIDSIKKRNGIIILVWRPEWENDSPNESQVRKLINYYIKTNIDGKVNGINEYPYNQINYFIRNNGTIEDLKAKVVNLGIL